MLALAHNVACAMAYLHQVRPGWWAVCAWCLGSGLLELGVHGPGCVGAATPYRFLCVSECATQAQTRRFAGFGSDQICVFCSLILSCAVQEHIIHGDLKASNVLLKTCAPTTAAAAAAPGNAAGQQGSAAAAAAGDPQGAAAAAASRGILDAAGAAAAADEETSASGMRSLLKCGWVVAKVSDFGLSMCVNPEETHVSSVHAVSGAWCLASVACAALRTLCCCGAWHTA